METAIRQVVSDAVTAAGVIDIYAASGIERPDLSIIDDEFAMRLTTNPHPNVQIELLRRLLASEVRSMSRRNVVAERKFSEMLERAMKSYNNRSLTAAEVIAELVELAKEMKAEHGRGTTLGLRDDELAFYDAVCQNDSAVMELGDEVFKRIAQELVDVVRANATVDWDKKEQVRASLVGTSAGFSQSTNTLRTSRRRPFNLSCSRPNCWRRGLHYERAATPRASARTVGVSASRILPGCRNLSRYQRFLDLLGTRRIIRLCLVPPFCLHHHLVLAL